MTNDALQHKVISDIPAFRALQPEWDALWHTAQGEHFQAFAYCASSLEIVAAAAGHKLHCVVGRRRGVLKALWPLVSYRKLCWRFVQPLAPAYNPPHDMLVEPGPDAANLVAATWRAMLASVRPDLVYLPLVRSGSLLHRCVTSDARVAHRLDESTPVALLREHAEWPAFCRSRIGRSRNPPAYLRRRIAAQGAIAIAIVDHTDSRAASFVDWLLLHKRRWAQRGDVESAWLFSDDSRQFLIRLMTQGDGQSRLFRLFVLTLDGAPVAINLLAVRSHCVDLIMNTYDAAYARLSPGTVLIDACVNWAFDNHLDFDFGAGGQSYKQFWSNGVAYATESLHLAHTQWGLAGYRLSQGALWARERVAWLRERASDTGAGKPAESSTAG